MNKLYELWKEKVLGKKKPTYSVSVADLKPSIYASTYTNAYFSNLQKQWAKAYWDQLDHKKAIEAWQIQFNAQVANAYKVQPYQTGYFSPTFWQPAGHAVNLLPTHTSICASCRTYENLLKYGALRSTRKPVVRHNGPAPDLSIISAGLKALHKSTEETR